MGAAEDQASPVSGHCKASERSAKLPECEHMDSSLCRFAFILLRGVVGWIAGFPQGCAMW